ncbi:MAG: hypothetical protein M3P26_05345 [Gemmatimonadota bacterium]|nr:hypothetical protein [Gemmatimonadota bacterium]
MRSLLLVAMLCLACSQNDDQLEADSASAANAIKGKFARVKAVAESTEKARIDSLARIAKQQADSQYAVAFAAIRKLPPDSFDSIPASVRSTLRERGCMIPQPYANEKNNAVKGAFTAKGTIEWAVTCALPTSTQALIISAESGAVVDSLNVAMDYTLGTLHGAAFAHRTTDDYGKSIPQPIDHDAIDVGILEKASIAYYRAGGVWYQIITSD